MAESNCYALIIGNSQYHDETLRRLVTPELDAQALASVLEDPAIGDFNVERLLDQESQLLREAVEGFFLDSKPDHTLLLYFSGHGILDDFGKLYLATINTTRKLLNATSIPAEFVRWMIDRSPANRKILILDCCYSGAFTSNMLAKGIKGESGIAGMLGLQFGRGVVILTASTALQYALEGVEVEELRKGVQSLFTRFLVQGLKTGEAAQGDKRFITVTDLFRYAEAQMKQAQVSQTPQITTIEQQGDIIIAKSVKPRKVTLPQGTRRLLKSNRRGDLLLAIEELGELAGEEDKELAKLAIEELKRLALLKSDIVVQVAAKAALAEIDVQPPEVPVIRFSSGELPESKDEWVSLAERNWDEATEFLYTGLLEKWLAYTKQPDLAREAKRIRRQVMDDRYVGLEQFQRLAGPINPQRKADAATNVDKLIGELTFWKMRRQKTPQRLTVKITNGGRGYMHGEVISKVPWIDVPQPRFGCLPGKTAEVDIVVDPAKRQTWRFSPVPLDFSLE